MSKEFKAFNDLMATYYEDNAIREKCGITEKTFTEKRKIIETALKDYEELDLRVKENNLLIDTFYKVIKKQEQVLKIIKKMYCFDEEYDCIEERDDYKLTETEFNLLKEYLK